MLNDRGNQILARFPGPVTVRPVLTLSNGLFIAVPMLVAIACLWGVWHGWHLEDSGSSTRVLGLCAALFGLFAAGSAAMLRTNSMTLDREGFEVVIGLWKKKKRFLWRDVSAFEKQHFGARDYGVAFDDARKAGGILAGMDRALGFRNSTLLEDYGLGDDQLAELLNHWRDRALAKASGDREPTGPWSAGR
jgi:hypothetical protein